MPEHPETQRQSNKSNKASFSSHKRRCHRNALYEQDMRLPSTPCPRQDNHWNRSSVAVPFLPTTAPPRIINNQQRESEIRNPTTIEIYPTVTRYSHHSSPLDKTRQPFEPHQPCRSIYTNDPHARDWSSSLRNRNPKSERVVY